MTTYATGNPLGSKDPRDLYDNAENFDAAMNDRVNTTWNDRFGVSRPTMKGYEEQFNDWLDAQGFEPGFLVYVDSIPPTPLIVDRPTQLIQRDGNLYSVKRPASFPVELTGNWSTDQNLLVAQVDRTLQDTLATSAGAGMIGYRERTVADRLNDTANVKDYGAIADGAYHPLSERFATLAEAQAVYPFVTSLSQSIDWAAIQSCLNEGGNVDFSGNPRSYAVRDMLVATVSGTSLNLAGCAINTLPGFQGINLFQLQADNIRIYGGATIDATHLPPQTADFSSAVWTGFAFAQRGTSGTKIKGLDVSGSIFVTNSPAAAFAVEYGENFVVRDIKADNCDNSATYVGPGVLFFNQCSNYYLDNLRSANFKWKGIYNTNGVDFSVHGGLHTDGVADQAAVFFRACTGFQVSSLEARRAFGFKFDSCSDFNACHLHSNCNGIGQLGVMIQGCIGYEVSGLFIRGYTIAGLEISYHPGPPPANAVVGKITGFNIRNGDVSSTAAVRIFGSPTEVAGQLSISSGYIYSCARGVQVRNVVDGATNRQLSLSDITVDTFSVCGLEGVSREYSANDIRFYNAAGTAVACVDLYHGASQVCDAAVIVGCHAPNLNSAVPLIRLATTASRHGLFNLVSIQGCTGNGGIRLLEVNIAKSTDYVRALTINGNSHTSGASANAITLANATSAVVPQVNIVGNTLLNTSFAKCVINFSDTAASGKWNGVVENNTASVANKPNNV